MAVSGGVDSMVMAALFAASPYKKVAIAIESTPPLTAINTEWL